MACSGAITVRCVHMKNFRPLHFKDSGRSVPYKCKPRHAYKTLNAGISKSRLSERVQDCTTTSVEHLLRNAIDVGHKCVQQLPGLLAAFQKRGVIEYPQITISKVCPQSDQENFVFTRCSAVNVGRIFRSPRAGLRRWVGDAQNAA